MAITQLTENMYAYGKTRYFAADRLYNDEPLYKFNREKIKAAEIVGFDSTLMDAREITAQELENSREDAQQILAVMLRPDIQPDSAAERIPGFEFCGYDLIELQTGISAITNCGAMFERAIDYPNLNRYALIDTYRQAVNTQLDLADKYPDDCHALCDIAEIWRRLI